MLRSLCACLSEPDDDASGPSESLVDESHIFKVLNFLTVKEASALMNFANEAGYSTTFHEAVCVLGVCASFALHTCCAG